MAFENWSIKRIAYPMMRGKMNTIRVFLIAKSAPTKRRLQGLLSRIPGIETGDAADPPAPTASSWPDPHDELALLNGKVEHDDEVQRERRCGQAERRQAELDRIESASRFETLVEQLPGIPYLIKLAPHGCSLYVSPKIRDMLGFTQSQWCTDPALRTRQLHPEDRPVLRAAIARATRENSGYSVDYRIFACDGSLHWVHDEARVLRDVTGTASFLQGVAFDVTEHRRSQGELDRCHVEPQQLAGRLDLLGPGEQRRLARDIHDDFGQLLAAMKMDISRMRKYLPPDSTQLVGCLRDINALTDAMVASVRRILADLPPKMLEDLGLFAALESMLASYETRHGIACTLKLPECEPALTAGTRTAIYRMMQEIFNNIAKHAQATQVDARIDCDDESLRLRVRDNGIGMAADKLHKRGSFGLTGIRERVASLGGDMSVDGTSGQGTAISITVPTRYPVSFDVDD